MSAASDHYELLRAFGGPVDGDMLPVKDGGPVYALLPIPDDLLTDETTAGDLPRVRYDVHTYGWWNGNEHFQARCLLAEDTRTERVTGPLNAIAGLALLAAGLRSRHRTPKETS